MFYTGRSFHFSLYSRLFSTQNVIGSSLQIRLCTPKFLSHPGMVSSVRSYQIVKALLLGRKDHQCANFNAGPIFDRSQVTINTGRN